ncbi:hypothetical protein [Streptomyces sp. CRN 30]|nr:hypothetical protein [Streptomyces sp. CRN 30]
MSETISEHESVEERPLCSPAARRRRSYSSRTRQPGAIEPNMDT